VLDNFGQLGPCPELSRIDAQLLHTPPAWQISTGRFHEKPSHAACVTGFLREKQFFLASGLQRSGPSFDFVDLPTWLLTLISTGKGKTLTAARLATTAIA